MTTAYEEDSIFVNQLTGMPEFALLELSHDELIRSIRYCQSCPLSTFTKPLSLHNHEARIMVVGEIPDDVLFETESGAVLAGLLRRFSILPQEVYVTALSKCRENQDSPACNHHLNAEILTIRPSVVILLGSNVAKAFDPNPAPNKWLTLYQGVYALETYSLLMARQDPAKMAMLHDQFAYVAKNRHQMQQV